MSLDALAMIAAAALFAQPAHMAAREPSCSGIETPQGLMAYDVFIVFFDRDSAVITPGAALTLDNVAATYRPLPHCQLNVWAHTDRVGPDAYNQVLSQRRGEAVIAHLRRLGVHATPHIEAFGESRLLVETADGVEERQNRRAEILISPRRGP